MAANGHYTGRIKRDYTDLSTQQIDRGGVFYSIFNRYGFFDISDTNNGLTKEQRAQVPKENQDRFTAFANAISEMISWTLANDDNGILTVTIQQIIDKLDARASMNAAQLTAISSGLSVTPLAPVGSAMKSVESLTGSMMGVSPYDPDMIPPFSLGMPGLPPGVANVFKPGFFQPNWDFLYNYEPVKSQKFYSDINGNPMIGAGIDLTIGGKQSEFILKKVFGVVSVDDKVNPQGDTVGGLTAEEFDVIATVSKTKTISDTAATFTLTDDQMRNSYYRYVQIVLWDVLLNKNNWAYNNWGSLTHNSMPEYVKSAVTSYVWDSGFNVQQDKNPTSGFISYCTQIGLYYLIGLSSPIKLTFIETEKVIGNNGVVLSGTAASDFLEANDGIAINGVPKDKTLANQYFTWIADILSRITTDASGEDFGTDKRKRRISEANMIYRGVGYQEINYGSAVLMQNVAHQVGSLRDRKFNKLVSSTIYTHPNKTYEPDKTKRPVGGNVKIVIKDRDIAFLESIGYRQDFEDWLKGIMNQVGISKLYITRTASTPAAQAAVMYTNEENGIHIGYAQGGRSVLDTYKKEKLRLGYGDGPVTKASDKQTILTAMTAKIEEVGPTKVSKHCATGSEAITFDISPNPSSVMPDVSKLNRFYAAMNELKKNGSLIDFFYPGMIGEPAIHISVPTPAHPDLGSASPLGTTAKFVVSIASEPITLTDPTLLHDTSWNSPLSRDFVAVNKPSVDA